MKYKFPIQCPHNHSLLLQQSYGEAKNIEWYKKNGIDIPFHNGVDITITPDPSKLVTYGAACVAPFNCRKVKTTWDSPLSTKGNGITLQSDPFIENGKEIILQIVFWHLSGIVDDQYFKEGEIVGYIGNSGAVSPAPTPECPYCGAHLHFMLFEFHDGMLTHANNGVKGAIDPFTRFDINSPYIGETDVAKDLPPVMWAFEKRGLTENWQKIVFAIKNWLKR
jgi:hypothetical protein